MSNESLLFIGWNIWAVIATCVVLFGGKKSKPLTLEEKWAIFRELADTPQLMADGRTLQRIEWRYVLHVPEAVEAPISKAPPTIARGRQPVTG
jgi:hypothetical protein